MVILAAYVAFHTSITMMWFIIPFALKHFFNLDHFHLVNRCGLLPSSDRSLMGSRQFLKTSGTEVQYISDAVVLITGIFSGVSMALLVGFLVLLSSTVQYRMLGGRKYMDTVFHVFSTLGLILLHMYMYGWNVYAWQRARINYPFIFEFSPGTELRYREVFLVCTALTSLLLGTMIAHIIASTREATHFGTSEFAPLGITLVINYSHI